MNIAEGLVPKQNVEPDTLMNSQRDKQSDPESHHFFYLRLEPQLIQFVASRFTKIINDSLAMQQKPVAQVSTQEKNVGTLSMMGSKQLFMI
jgi:hypothetical protein